MEFFKTIPASDVTSQDLQQLLSIDQLPALCRSISSVISDEQTHGVIYCLWGEFKINREVLKQGIRFSLPTCPNAFVWSITVEEDRSIVIHGTINKMTHDDDFLDSIAEFFNDWWDGVRQHLN